MDRWQPWHFFYAGMWAGSAILGLGILVIRALVG